MIPTMFHLSNCKHDTDKRLLVPNELLLCAWFYTLLNFLPINLSFSLFSFSVHVLFIIVIETLVMIKKEINDPIAVIIVICSILNLVLSMTLAMLTMPKIPSTRTEMRYGLGFDDDIIIDLFEFFGDCF